MDGRLKNCQDPRTDQPSMNHLPKDQLALERSRGLLRPTLDHDRAGPASETTNVAGAPTHHCPHHCQHQPRPP